MAERKGSPRAQVTVADEGLRRGREDESAPVEKRDVAEELVRAVRILVRETEILPGEPLS
jgi:hypothetical protein